MLKKILPKITYFLIISTLSIPMIFIFIVPQVIRFYIYLTGGHESDYAGLGFILILVGLPICAVLISLGIVLSLLLSLLTKNKKLKIITIILSILILSINVLAYIYPLRPDGGWLLNVGFYLFSVLTVFH